MAIEIRKAERTKAKLRLGLAGPSGAGKTMSALKLAQGIAKGTDQKVVLIDTERGSGDLYADLYEYSIISIEPPYTPQKYVDAIVAAEEAGFGVIIIDSLSHAWSDEGGILDQADKKSAGGNRFTVWAELTPQHRRLVGGMLNSKAHIIATTRSKQQYELEEFTDSRGNKKSRPVKLGMAPVQREGMEYEFTIFMDIDQHHNATASKDRTNLFKDRIFTIDEKIGLEILDWLNKGDDPAVAETNRIKTKIVHCLKLLKKDVSTPDTIKAAILEETSLDGGDSANGKEILRRLEAVVKSSGPMPWHKPIAAHVSEAASAGGGASTAEPIQVAKVEAQPSPAATAPAETNGTANTSTTA
jgi:hypothetical protein